MPERYLVTGAAGFIGSQVTRRLLDEGNTVVGIDNFNTSYDPRLKDWRLTRSSHRCLDFNAITPIWLIFRAGKDLR